MKKTVLCAFSLLLMTRLLPVAMAAPIEIGWSEADITPPLTKRIPLMGQSFVDRLRTRIHEIEPAINTNAVYMGGVHTHSAPAFWYAWTPEGDEAARKQPDVLGATEYAESLHVTRIGDVAMFTCPFELYLDYGQIIKARSVAKQTFDVSMCGYDGYLPTHASEETIG